MIDFLEHSVIPTQMVYASIPEVGPGTHSCLPQRGDEGVFW